ncbi:DUF559 domain-containing protein [Noviluteimonas gilva]|uniref:DUF559 domain-containing protein n=1 Tax=Noviluteimonas gilva TaxID=2682097 RepID=A0A7C9HL95_9GAMM|nr:DUF559 domain-containing protein [Lysobacter gilvus]
MTEPDVFYADWDDLGIPENARKGWAAACGRYFASDPLQLWERHEIDWGEQIAERHHALYSLFNCGVESPIEQTMAGWLCWLDADFFGFVDACHEPWFDDDYRWGEDEWGYSVMPQVQVGSYRVDFLILVRGFKGKRRIAIECDGHDYHDKTKEQAARDKKRDRDLLLAGVSVMRFTGSEIFRDCEACFLQIQEAVCKASCEVM